MPGPRHEADLRTTVRGETLRVELSTSAVVFDRSTEYPTVGLRFGRIGVGPDVSVQPAAVTAVIDDEARLAAADPNRWRLEVLRALLDWEPDLGWCDRSPTQLTAAVGAFTHPLLAELYRQGSVALDDVPRWASPILRCAGAADAARRLTGGATNRRVTRAIAGSLRGVDGRVDLGPLALAVAGAGSVSLDELANVVEAASGSSRPSPVVGVEQLRTIRSGLRYYTPRRRAALLVDAARHHSPARLADVMARLSWVADHAPRPLPQRVDELADLCARLVPVLASRPAMAEPVPGQLVIDRDSRVPGPPDATPQPTTSVDGRPDPRPRRAGRAALAAPTAPSRAPQRWPVPQALLPISGHRSGVLTFCVPTSGAELTWWSRQLHNCLDTFAAAAAHQRSWLIGIRRDDRLVGCIEVCPRTRRLRQAHGPRNRPLPSDVHDTAIGVLVDAGILVRPTPR